MKSPKGQFILDEIFTKEIQNLLHKKVFAKSKYFYGNNKLPKDQTKIIPIRATSKLNTFKSYTICVLILIIYFINIFRLKSRDSGKELILVYSLSKEQSVRNNSIKSLYAFLESKGLVSNPNSVVLIEIRKMLLSKKYRNAKTTLDIPLRIFIDNFAPNLRVICWLSMCKKFFIIMQQRPKNLQLSMIFKEFIFDQIIYSAMDSNKIDKLITTQSNLAYQPLIFEHENITAKKFMIWYSSNSVPIKYKNKKLKRFFINPNVYINMRIDEHWVWTKEHKNYLSKYSQAKILVKHSLMFYTAENLKASYKEVDVLLFDVLPSNISKITQNSIYTTRESMNFINEIVTCVTKLNQKYKKNYRIQLKNKRRFSKNHSLDYLKFIDQKVKNFEIEIIDSQQNLYDLIVDSKLVIGFPFTSPVVIGQELNKPSIFYCSSKLLPTVHKSQRPLFIQSQARLYSYMEKILIKSK